MVGGLGATIVGTPEQVADEFERWVEEGDVDGFNIVSISVFRFSLADHRKGIRHHAGLFHRCDRTSVTGIEEEGLVLG